MSRVDPIRLSQAISFLLKQPKPGTPMRPDAQGWVNVEDLREGVATLLGEAVTREDLQETIEGQRRPRFELLDDRLRCTDRSRRNRPSPVPDILYHATSARRAAAARASGTLRHPDGKPLFLSTSEVAGWRVAHRLAVPDPTLLYVDAGRARRRGVHFERQRHGGVFTTTAVPTNHVLNLLPNFGHQLSAGGLPVRVDDSGDVRVALIRVTRRSGITWEVAKGKMEDGEVPEMAAVREVQEEMGVDCDLRVVHHIANIRYGFTAPGALVRLKTVFLYLMRPLGDMSCFTPALSEGIGDVAWFTPHEAVRAVTHPSLVPQIIEVRRLLTDTPTVAAILGDDAGRVRTRR